MKTVFTDLSTIAHLWANQVQSEGKNPARNFYFNENTIYSYGSHFPIARHVKNSQGENAVLFTERSYSVTTSKHIRIVASAANHKNIIYCFKPDANHMGNFKFWQSEIEAIAANLPKSKKPEIYLSQISRITYKVNQYANFFSLTIPESLQAAMAIGGKDQYKDYAAKKEQFEKEQKEREQKELAKRHKKELNEWLKGKTYRLYTRNGFDYLRVNNNRIETSQAVQIPLEMGKGLWQSIKENSIAVGAHVLGYEVTEVGKEITIGCHHFKKDYLLKFGENLFN